jgi:hypothetical protein
MKDLERDGPCYASLTFTGRTLTVFSIWSPERALNLGKTLASVIAETGDDQAGWLDEKAISSGGEDDVYSTADHG